MPESCTSRFLVRSVLSYEKMLSQQKKKKNSNLRILFDVSKEHIRKLEVHPSDSAFSSTSFMQVCYEGKKRKIICVIYIWCVQCIGSDCSYVLFCMLHPQHDEASVVLSCFSPQTMKINFSIINGREIKELAQLSQHYSFMVSILPFSCICSSNLPSPIELPGKSLLKIPLLQLLEVNSQTP